MSDFSIGRLGTSSRPSLGRVVAGSVAVLREMLRARATRRLLREMDDRLLSDIGVGRGDAMDEASRPMWDLAQRPR